MKGNRVKSITAIVLDVDGVLTDGRLYYDASGECIKTFHAHDGAGIVSWIRSGGKIALLSGRNTPIVARRAANLGIEDVLQGHEEKEPAFESLLKRWGISARQVCYVGDDLPDIPVMRQCGFAVAVANALPEVKAAAKYVTKLPGGSGAVRETIDLLMKKETG